MLFKALAEESNGDLSVMERALSPSSTRPPSHRHLTCSETYFVLEGQVAVVIENEELLLGVEDFVLVPRGAAHTFGVGGDDNARLMIVHAPAMDPYFAGLHELWSREEPPTADEERALMARFGMEPAAE